MRNRVVNYVPGQESRLFLGTFHSFCADVLRQHGTHIGVNPNFIIYSQENDLKAVLHDAVERIKDENDFVSDLDKKLLSVIQWLKSQLIPPEKCFDMFRDEIFGRRVSVVYPAYESELTKRNALDFNSLLQKTHLLFSKYPNLAKRYRTVYPYICIDEFQDTNEAQYSLITALTGSEHRNLFVVADDDQIIYQWNGASQKRIEQFKKDYSPKHTIQLPMNYRCPYEVVVMANHLITYNIQRTIGKKPLEAFHQTQTKNAVRLLPIFEDNEKEFEGVAQDVKNFHINELTAVVVLARSRKLLEGMLDAFRRIEVPEIIAQRKDEFERYSICMAPFGSQIG